MIKQPKVMLTLLAEGCTTGCGEIVAQGYRHRYPTTSCQSLTPTCLLDFYLIFCVFLDISDCCNNKYWVVLIQLFGAKHYFEQQLSIGEFALCLDPKDITGFCTVKNLYAIVSNHLKEAHKTCVVKKGC